MVESATLCFREFLAPLVLGGTGSLVVGPSSRRVWRPFWVGGGGRESFALLVGGPDVCEATVADMPCNGRGHGRGWAVECGGCRIVLPGERWWLSTLAGLRTEKNLACGEFCARAATPLLRQHLDLCTGRSVFSFLRSVAGTRDAALLAVGSCSRMRTAAWQPAAVPRVHSHGQLQMRKA